ncbi:MAG: hypothetical protein ACR2Q4_18370 [Geminicoccaceae bacterium]
MRFGQCLAKLCDDLEASRVLVEQQCLSAAVMISTIVYLLTRITDGFWVLPMIIPVIAIGGASLQHAIVLYGHYVRSNAMPAICDAIGRLRYTVGHAPDLCFERMIRTGMMPRFGQRVISDVVFGDYRGHELTLAMVHLWPDSVETSSDSDAYYAFQGLAVAIHWPTDPGQLPCDQLTRLIEGRDHARLAWTDNYLILTIPCAANPFAIGSLFDTPAHTAEMLTHVASIVQIPHRLIDLLLEQAPK